MKKRIPKTIIPVLGLCLMLSSCNNKMELSDKATTLTPLYHDSVEISASARAVADQFEQQWNTANSGSTSQSESTDSINGVEAFIANKISVAKDRTVAAARSPEFSQNMKGNIAANITDASLDSATMTSSYAFQNISKTFYKSYASVFSSYASADSLNSSEYKTAIRDLVSQTNTIIDASEDIGDLEKIQLLKYVETVNILDQRMQTMLGSSAKTEMYKGPIMKAWYDIFNPWTWISASLQTAGSLFTGDPIGILLKLYTISPTGFMVGTVINAADLAEGSDNPFIGSDYAKMTTSSSISGSTIKTMYTIKKIYSGSFMSLGSSLYNNYVKFNNNKYPKLSSLVANAMGVGAQLYPGNSIYSPDKTYRLTFQSDGNLVIYRVSDGRAKWSTRTEGKKGAYAAIALNGKLLIYSSKGASIWNSGGYSPGASVLDYKSYITLDNNGNLWLTTSYAKTRCISN